MVKDIFILETRAGEPLYAGRYKLIPFTQALQIRLPGMPGGLIWNRPKSIIVISPDGDEQLIPVPDITRQALWKLFASAMAITLIAGLVYGINYKNKEN